jgi:hypothetical protein
MNVPRRAAPRGSFFLSALLAVPLVAACGDLGSGSAAGEDRALEPAVEELYRVGSVEGGRWDAFARISSVAFGDDRRLHMLDPQQRRVHVVDSSGAHLFSFGVSGDGPGEFRSPVGVQALADGRIVVADSGHEAFLVFSPDGAYLRSVRYDSGGATPGARLQRQGDWTVIAHAQGLRIEASSGGGPPTLPTTTPVDRWNLGTGDAEVARERVLEAWRPERAQARPQARAQDGPGGAGMGLMMLGARRAFEPGVHFAVLPDGRLALADSSTYQIRIYGPDGGGEPAVIGRDIAPRPVGPAEEEAERERQLAELEAGGGPQMQIQTSGPGGGGVFTVPQEQIRDMQRQQMESMVFWHEIPVITRLAADAEGRLWVERSAGIGEEGPIDLLDAEGNHVGTIAPGGVRTPVAFGPGGLAAWVELDELEVPSVRVGRIRFE